jgi:23S rRNA (guanosine2251-2'-O)-methyltransferase
MNEYIPGRNGVAEALKAGRSFIKLYVGEGKTEGSLKEILAKAKAAGIPIQRVPKKKLDALYCGNHQGVIGAVAAYEYAEVDDMLSAAAARGEDPFLLMLAEVEDPHNLGAIMRTAEIAGAHGIIIPKNNSVGLNATVAKTAAGATEYLPVARVANLVQTTKDLKNQGLWVYGAAMEGSCLWQQEMKGPLLLVIGGEDRGIPRLLLQNCDFKVTIPMQGHVPSLNASVAAGVMIYEILRQRNIASLEKN